MIDRSCENQDPSSGGRVVNGLTTSACIYMSTPPPFSWTQIIIQPILNKMTDEQETDKVVWTPSTMIERLGREIDNEESIYYWCAKVNHPLPRFEREAGSMLKRSNKQAHPAPRHGLHQTAAVEILSCRRWSPPVLERVLLPHICGFLQIQSCLSIPVPLLLLGAFFRA